MHSPQFHDKHSQRSPLLRGYWTDEELISLTGLKSLGLARDLQRKRLVEPGKYRKASGQRARAWSIEDLLRIRLAAEFAIESGFSLAASATMLQCVGRSAIDQALAINRSREALSLYQNRQTNADTTQSPESVILREYEVIAVVENRKFLSRRIRDHTNGKSPQVDELGTLLDAHTPYPVVVTDWKEPEEDDPVTERSELRVNLHMLGVTFIENLLNCRVVWPS